MRLRDFGESLTMHSAISKQYTRVEQIDWHTVTHCAWSEPPTNTLFLGHTRVTHPNGISIGSAVFCRAHDRDKQNRRTDRPRYFVCGNRPHLAIAVNFLRCSIDDDADDGSSNQTNTQFNTGCCTSARFFYHSAVGYLMQNDTIHTRLNVVLASVNIYEFVHCSSLNFCPWQDSKFRTCAP